MKTGARQSLPAIRGVEHPGSPLRNYLPNVGLSVRQAARDLAITRQSLHRILVGNGAMTPKMVARLEGFRGVSSEFRLNCQHRFELQHVKEGLDSYPLAIFPRTNHQEDRS